MKPGSIHVPELLSPAGSYDALCMAIAAGADAVYLGGRAFGARQYAKNFSDEELLEAVNHAHLRGVKVYVTVNTLVHDTEIPDIIGFIRYLHSIRVDGVLVQDRGLLSVIRNTCPDLEIHASTQMGIHNIPGAVLAAHSGCRRIVPARELRGEEIRSLAKALNPYGTELEVFIHGALCYGYSGYCLLSSFIGGRSGNRGMCAQPCRKLYHLVAGTSDNYGRITDHHQVPQGNAFLMSTRDLCLYPVLPSIISLPVASLKIEGRMRSPRYVATVTAIYRHALDQIRSGSFSPVQDDIQDLLLAFSRDFTTGYISGNTSGEVMNRAASGNRGLFIGTIRREISPGRYEIVTSSGFMPEQGDGMVFRRSDRETGYILKDVPVQSRERVTIDGPKGQTPGTEVWQTKSHRQELFIRTLEKEPDSRYYGRLGLQVQCDIDDQGVVMISGEISDPDGISNTFAYRSEHRLVAARTQPLTVEQIQGNLLKCGKTLFRFDRLDIRYGQGLFAPPKILNEIRRELFARAGEAYLTTWPRQDLRQPLLNESLPNQDGVVPEPLAEPRHPKLIVLVSSDEEMEAAIEAGADIVLWEWSPGISLERMSEIRTIASGRSLTGLVLPRIISDRDRDALEKDLDELVKTDSTMVMTDSTGIAEYYAARYPQITWSGFSGLNITNSESVRLHSLFSLVTLSPELSQDEIREIASRTAAFHHPALAVLVQGELDALITRDTLHELACTKHDVHQAVALVDERMQYFPVKTGLDGRTRICNSAELSLWDEIPWLIRTGIPGFVVTARGRGPVYAGEMTAYYRETIDAVTSGKPVPDKLKEQIRRRSTGGMTTGGYRRGLTGNAN